MKLALEKLRLDGGTQTREVLNTVVCDQYAEAMRGGAAFPPVVVFYDGERHWLADGFHRVQAAKAAGFSAIEADVRQGTRRDAILFSVGANAAHGLPRTNADKRRAVTTLLRDAEWGAKSDNWIAKKCAVTQPFVSKLRQEIESTYNGYKSTTRQGIDGRVTNTANIGRGRIQTLPKVDWNSGKIIENLRTDRVPGAARALVLSGHADDVQSATRAVKEAARERVREQNRALVAAAPAPAVAAAGQRFATLVLDPPWDWGDEGDADQLGRARPTYATMTIDQIAALPVPDLAAPNAHLYLWITNRSLPKGFALLERWGFRYVTCVTWCKPSFGMGNYFRGSTEHVLFGVRGSLPLLRKDVGTHFAAARPPRHSQKPDEFYLLVEACSPGPWLELFARDARPGWRQWGAETPPP